MKYSYLFVQWQKQPITYRKTEGKIYIKSTYETHKNTSTSPRSTSHHMALVDAQNSAIPGGIPPKWEKTCHRSGQTAMQNFTPIGKAQAEKSVTVYTNKVKYCKLSIPRYTVLRMAG